MLGGGVFVTQDKTLPGSYINFVNTTSVGATLGERGIVAIALPLNKNAGKVIELTPVDFTMRSTDLLGFGYDADELAPLREIFCNATKVYLYDLGEGGNVADAIAAFEPYEFNVLCAYTGVELDITTYITAVKNWRDEMGKKCQLVVYNAKTPNHEGVINVTSVVSDEGADAHALVAWVAGAQAGCKISESCTNKLYNGEYTIVTNKTQAQLTSSLKAGEFVFHLVYGDVRVLEDINSFTTTTETKGEDFKSNQTIRVIDQIANDIAKLYNTKYLGRIANNKSGRVSLWGDIVAHHRKLEGMQAIEDFNADLVTVEPGTTKKSVVVKDVITVTNTMAQLYMTVVVQ